MRNPTVLKYESLSRGKEGQICAEFLPVFEADPRGGRLHDSIL